MSSIKTQWETLTKNNLISMTLLEFRQSIIDNEKKISHNQMSVKRNQSFRSCNIIGKIEDHKINDEIFLIEYEMPNGKTFFNEITGSNFLFGGYNYKSISLKNIPKKWHQIFINIYGYLPTSKDING